MSTFVKPKLKAAREAIKNKDYEKARDQAQGALEYEPENYNAYVPSFAHLHVTNPYAIQGMCSWDLPFSI